MTNVFQAAKKKVVTRTLAVSALAVVGAAGISAGPVHANPYGGNYDNTGITTQQNNNVNANENSGSQTSANYKESTKYVYYENMVDANFNTSQFNNKSLNSSMNDYANFFRSTGNQGGMDWLYSMGYQG